MLNFVVRVLYKLSSVILKSVFWNWFCSLQGIGVCAAIWYSVSIIGLCVSMNVSFICNLAY
jgi:hypothetical protein